MSKSNHKYSYKAIHWQVMDEKGNPIAIVPSEDDAKAMVEKLNALENDGTAPRKFEVQDGKLVEKPEEPNDQGRS